MAGQSGGRTGWERVYAFGPYRLIPSRQRLLHGDRAVRLGGRAFELLCLLVQHSGTLVGKKELMAAAWPDIFVHESNLKVNLHNLRRSLGDTQMPPTYIATIAGRGYRFVAPVEVSDHPTGADEAAPGDAEPRSFPPAREMVGRDAEVAAILADLRARRHVSVVGAGGIGKTTVALAAAHAFEADCPDGLCFVDLATIDDPLLLPSALVTALGLRGNAGDMLAAVIDHLRDRRMLVLLDSCEHVLSAVSLFAGRLIAAGSAALLLATSREPLRLADEHVVWLDALALPPPGLPLVATTALTFSAIDLFVRRAVEWSGYQFIDGDCTAIARICRALDGLPLAIELVAAKVDQHPVGTLPAMLNEHLGFRNRKAGAAPLRQETLMATIDWSYRLLSRDEAAVYRLVSVFADAFDQDDAVAIATVAPLAPVAVAVALGGLVAKSLLAAQVDGPALCYRLLDSTRRHAARRRREGGGDVRALPAHAERMLDIFAQAEEEWHWRDTGLWTRLYRRRLPDLRAALAWAFDEGGHAALGIRLTVAAIPLWFEASLLSEAQAAVERALDLSEQVPCDDLLKAKLAGFRAWSMIYTRTLLPGIEAAWRDAIALAERSGSAEHSLRAQVGLCFFLIQTGRMTEAAAYADVFVGAPDAAGTIAPEIERMRAWARAFGGELAESRVVLDRLAATYDRPDGHSRMAGIQVDRFIGIRCYLPFVAWLGGDADTAVTAADDAVKAAGNLGHIVSQSNALGLAALPVALWTGDDAALDRYTALLRANLEREPIALWAPVERFFAAALADLRGADGTAAMREAIDAMVEARFTMRIGMHLGMLADALARQDRLEEAMATIAEAHRYNAEQGERWCHAETQRIEAAILERAGHAETAETLRRAALAEAYAIGALAFELRAATDLAAQCLNGGRFAEAVALLAPVHRRFDEGLATRDLIAAKALLQHAEAGKARSV
ncbi:putative ATPase/DNA-binding winged helix-turn-helix (wHTH) protein [Sphingomonas zeicaulis]|uniref:ATP-binding protein n=1 Tax=Sphingomonas zeicaulis TaxID=1632740 RepID=UPI003D1D7AF5